ncbi:MAG: hypothetical protein HFF71_13080 [Oscillospiraceae bacterium]|nr:hypothetical protein [Oscillospiraceae bacterium]
MTTSSILLMLALVGVELIVTGELTLKVRVSVLLPALTSKVVVSALVLSAVTLKVALPSLPVVTDVLSAVAGPEFFLVIVTVSLAIGSSLEPVTVTAISFDPPRSTDAVDGLRLTDLTVITSGGFWALHPVALQIPVFES